MVLYRARVYHGNDTLIASKANDGCGKWHCLLSQAAREIRTFHFALLLQSAHAVILSILFLAKERLQGAR